jgi:hypothetical protein
MGTVRDVRLGDDQVAASASLYVGMTRGRDRNHAHVVCDSHDHTELELGDLTGQQAFAAATLREPNGQLSAHSVQQRWQTGQADRTAARAADRKRRDAAHWWTVRERGLPPAMRAAIAGRHQDILDILAGLPDHHSRLQAISAAASSVNWRLVGAADQFIQRLARSSASSSCQQPPHGHTATYQR